MIQIKSIAMLMIAIATIGAIGTAGLLVQRANADNGYGNGATPGNGQGSIVQKGTTCILGPPPSPGSPPPTSTEGHKVFQPNGGAHVNCHA